MDMPTHTFPLPEPETHKLDNVTEELRHQPAYQKAKDFVRANPWRAIGIAFGTGLMMGMIMR